MDNPTVNGELRINREVSNNDATSVSSATSTSRPGKRTCTFFIDDKKRPCRMIVKEGEDVCVVHFEDPNPKRRRVQCPLDPKHTVFTYSLQRHLTKCNARKTESLHPFYAHELNGGGSDITHPVNTPSVVPSEVTLSLRDLDDAQLLKLTDKIDAISKLYLPEAATEIGSSSCKALQEEIESTLNGNEARRHLRQTSSIVHLLEKLGCLKPNTCFIEFGSGKGGLTYWLGTAVGALPQPETQSFVLVDRTSPRHKRDNKLQPTDFQVERIRLDIKDLKLDQVKFVAKSEHLVGLSKHLCGSATDLALTCLLHTNSLMPKVSGIVFATCCHHQCEWTNFVGKSSFLKWGFTQAEFKSLTGITSWFVCGTGSSKFAKSGDDVTSLKYSRVGLDFEERRLLGWKAKRLLDFARCEFIKSKGLDSRFSEYVSTENTFENVCIIGGKPAQVISSAVEIEQIGEGA